MPTQGFLDIMHTLVRITRIICPPSFTWMPLFRFRVLTGWTEKRAQEPLLLAAVPEEERKEREMGRQTQMNTEALNAAA